MTVKQRILALRLLQKQKQFPDYASRIGIRVNMVKKNPDERNGKHV